MNLHIQPCLFRCLARYIRSLCCVATAVNIGSTHGATTFQVHLNVMYHDKVRYMCEKVGVYARIDTCVNICMYMHV